MIHPQGTPTAHSPLLSSLSLSLSLSPSRSTTHVLENYATVLLLSQTELLVVVQEHGEVLVHEEHVNLQQDRGGGHPFVLVHLGDVVPAVRGEGGLV